MNSRDSAGKTAILGAIRRGLQRGPLPEDQQAMLRARMAAHPRHIIPARSRVSRPRQVALFLDRLEKEFASWDRVASEAEIPEAVADYLAEQNLPPRFVMAPHPELTALPWQDRPLLQFETRRAEGSDDVSLQHAFAGIAETGTLMFPSDPARPTTLNVLPETAIAVLRVSRLVGAYEEAWDLLRGRQDTETGGFMPRNVMLVTGPSRSADIEQHLELGAHGPRRLHVIVIDDDPAALESPQAGPDGGATPPPTPPPTAEDEPG